MKSLSWFLFTPYSRSNCACNLHRLDEIFSAIINFIWILTIFSTVSDLNLSSGVYKFLHRFGLSTINGFFKKVFCTDFGDFWIEIIYMIC